jgi:hypothetical protein
LAGVASSSAVLSAEYMNRSFRTPAEVEGILSIPLLAAIPTQSASQNGQPTIVEVGGQPIRGTIVN